MSRRGLIVIISQISEILTREWLTMRRGSLLSPLLLRGWASHMHVWSGRGSLELVEWRSAFLYFLLLEHSFRFQQCIPLLFLVFPVHDIALILNTCFLLQHYIVSIQKSR